MSDALCPCGSSAAYDACCGRFHAGDPAPTALALMRSRYTAFVHGLIDYLIDTHDPATRASLDVAAATAWSRDTAWAGLEIVSATDTTVEFIARGTTRGAPFTHHERSRFRHHAGRWYYTDGTTPPAVSAPTPGRNASCPCGSGAKYKRCHGA